jgi:hypothetical protein
MHTLLHLESASSHTCTHIALWHDECNEAVCEDGIRRTRIYSIMRKDYLPGSVIRLIVERSEVHRQPTHMKVISD